MRRCDLFSSLCEFAVSCLELRLSLRQTLRQVADPGVFAFGRLMGNRGLGFLGLRGLWTPAHQPLLASYEVAGDRLGEPAGRGKGAAKSDPHVTGDVHQGANADG